MRDARVRALMDLSASKGRDVEAFFAFFFGGTMGIVWGLSTVGKKRDVKSNVLLRKACSALNQDRQFEVIVPGSSGLIAVVGSC